VQAHLLTPLSDPGHQFAWLTATLAAARDAGEKVWIAAHVAPGPRSSSGSICLEMTTDFTGCQRSSRRNYSDEVNSDRNDVRRKRERERLLD
jgi:hypothetical protein